VPKLQLLRRVSRRLAAAAGVEIVRRDDGALSRLAAAGVEARSVVDGGAALGDWARACASVYANARYILVEPLEEFRPALAGVARELGARVVEAALASEPGTRTLHVHADLVGSSLLREREGEHVDGEPRDVPATTVDAVVAEHGLEPPYVLKLDVQGAEREALAGAEETLAKAAAVVVEVSFFDFFRGGTEFADLVAAMRERGLVVYEIGNLSRRPLDGALAQADVVFVPEDSAARREHVYAAPEQRAARTHEFRAAIQRRIDRAR
jgi:FkbM family methyltransferase